ncbi:general stress protein [Arthrobacter sp. MYb213]|uniref:general stress protein n=1 Tax=Arthrobacter sp. MYb213 TaxID=1848595 RepID=UPI0015E38593|nr:general stress protein [Arthrobacter sp. MYb213]
MTSPHGVNSISPNGLPRGELLGRYTSYLDAQKLVDYLADNNFPVSAVTIVGNDVRTVERVTAKLSYPKVALAGAAQGGMMGLFVGLLLSLFGGTGNGLYQILSAIGLGMAIWMIAGVVSYSTRRGKRDFASSSKFVATSFDVVVDFEHAQAARQMASQLPMRPQQASAAQQPVQPVQPPVAPVQPQPPVTTDGVQAPAQAPAQAPTAQPAPTSQFNDLPDGRPRYGVRVDEPKSAAPEQPQNADVAAAEPTVAQPAVKPEAAEPTAAQPAVKPEAAEAPAEPEGDAKSSEEPKQQ